MENAIRHSQFSVIVVLMGSKRARTSAMARNTYKTVSRIAGVRPGVSF